MKKTYWYFESIYSTGDDHPFGGNRSFEFRDVEESDSNFFPLCKVRDNIQRKSKRRLNYTFTIIQEISAEDYLALKK